MTTYDTIILGSSPDALTAAAYLARSGQKVLVLESSPIIGGAVSTVQFAEEFQADTSFISGRISDNIAKELKLEQHGLEVIERNYLTSLLPGGASFTLPADRKEAAEVIRKFSPTDADRYERFMNLLDIACDFLKSAYAMTPQAHPPTAEDTRRMMELVAKLRGYGNREMTEVMRLLVMSVRDLLEEWFESPQLKGLLGASAMRGIAHGPFAGATTFTLLHHLTINDGFFRSTAKGGIGSITRALAAAAKSLGAELRAGTGPAKVLIEDGTAVGVRLDSGEIKSTHVVSDHDARQTFTALVDPPELEPEFNRAVQRIKYNGAVARVNLALSALPDFAGVTKEALSGTLVLAPSLAYLEKALDAAKYGKLADEPFIEIAIPSVSDSTLAPLGKHVMSICIQYATYRTNTDADKLLVLAIEKLTAFAPDLRSLVLHSQVTTPRDYEQRFGLTEGHLYGGDMTLTQAFFLRPVPGYARYRTPINQLFLCGPATHPGGGISGLSGHNLSVELGTRDLALA